MTNGTSAWYGAPLYPAGYGACCWEICVLLLLLLEIDVLLLVLAADVGIVLFVAVVMLDDSGVDDGAGFVRIVEDEVCPEVSCVVSGVPCGGCVVLADLVTLAAEAGLVDS